MPRSPHEKTIKNQKIQSKLMHLQALDGYTLVILIVQTEDKHQNQNLQMSLLWGKWSSMEYKVKTQIKYGVQLINSTTLTCSFMPREYAILAGKCSSQRGKYDADNHEESSVVQ